MCCISNVSTMYCSTFGDKNTSNVDFTKHFHSFILNVYFFSLGYLWDGTISLKHLNLESFRIS